MKIVVVQGSTRAKSQSRKVADRVIEKLQTLQAQPVLIDLHELKLPVYDDSGQPEWPPVAQHLEQADGYVLISPEWNGSASPGILNFLTFASVGKQKPLAHKPAIIVSVSSGAGGSYPISNLKSYGNKNNHPVFIPEHVRVRDVEHYMNSQQPEEGNDIDKTVHDRLEHALKVLVLYAEKIADIRTSGIVDLEKYPHGF